MTEGIVCLRSDSLRLALGFHFGVHKFSINAIFMCQVEKSNSCEQFENTDPLRSK
jgi:hypothetical protein